ncbi:hypothetical protein [Chitinophaga flava]|nr:hypothetical protein [Chitinophaga flava]
MTLRKNGHLPPLTGIYYHLQTTIPTDAGSFAAATSGLFQP